MHLMQTLFYMAEGLGKACSLSIQECEGVTPQCTTIPVLEGPFLIYSKHKWIIPQRPEIKPVTMTKRRKRRGLMTDFFFPLLPFPSMSLTGRHKFKIFTAFTFLSLTDPVCFCNSPLVSKNLICYPSKCPILLFSSFKFKMRNLPNMPPTLVTNQYKQPLEGC